MLFQIMQRMVNDMGIISENQQDMLLRILMDNPELRDKTVSENNMNRIKSAVLFNTLIKKDMVVGYTNQQVYDIYCELAKTISIKQLSMIDFSRTLCKFYGFQLIDVHTPGNNMKRRVYIRDEKEFFKNHRLQSALEFMSGLDVNDLVGRTNQEIYADYLTFCQKSSPKKNAINKIDFSRRLCIFHGVTIKNTTRKGKSCRVYFLKKGGHHGDNTSGQENLG